MHQIFRDGVYANNIGQKNRMQTIIGLSSSLSADEIYKKKYNQ
jgi:hypothetical protein